MQHTQTDCNKLLSLEVNDRRFLYMKDLWQPIKTVNDILVGKPAEMKDVDWEVLNRKCAAQIRQWIDRSIMQSVAKETDAYKLWEKLEKTYAQPSA